MFAIYQLVVLETTELWFALFALGSGLSAFISGGFWQKWLRKWGNNTVFVIAAALLTANTLITPFIPNVQLMTLFSIFTGFSAVGINTALLNGVLEATPGENRMMYLAFYNTIFNISLFIAPLFAHQLGRIWGNNTALFVVSILRGAGALYIWWAYRRSKRKMAQ